MSALAYNDVRRLGAAPPQREVQKGDWVKCVRTGRHEMWRYSARRHGRIGELYKVLDVSEDFSKIQVYEGTWADMNRFQITARAALA